MTASSPSAGRILGSSWTERHRMTKNTATRPSRWRGRVRTGATAEYVMTLLRLFFWIWHNSQLCVIVGEPDARAWLEQHVVTPYWVAHAPRFPHSLHLHSNLLNVWWDSELLYTDPCMIWDEKRPFINTRKHFFFSHYDFVVKWFSFTLFFQVSKLFSFSDFEDYTNESVNFRKLLQ